MPSTILRVRLLAGSCRGAEPPHGVPLGSIRGFAPVADQRITKAESCTFGVHEDGYVSVTYLVKQKSETVF